MADFTNFRLALASFGKKQVKDAKNRLKRNKKGDGALYDSIDYEVQGNFTLRPSVRFNMNDYGAFVDTGVEGIGGVFYKGTDKEKRVKKRKPLKGQDGQWANTIFGLNQLPKFTGKWKMINTKALDKWVIKKGLDGTRDAKGRFMTRSAMKIAIASSIYKKGLKGTGFFSKPLLLNMIDMKDEVEKALVKDLESLLKFDKYFV